MFDPQFRLSSDPSGNSSNNEDITSNNGPWPQMSLDRLLEHHDITPAKPISMKDTSSNDFWSSPVQFNDFLTNYHRQYHQQNQPLDISSLLSSSPPQSSPVHQNQPVQKHFPYVDNHIFEPPTDVPPLYYDPYASEKQHMPMRRDSFYQAALPPPHHQPSYNPYQHRARQTAHFQNQNHRAPPVLQIPPEDASQKTSSQGPRHRQNQMPAYVACLNHGINYNGVSGPPILLPPSF